MFKKLKNKKGFTLIELIVVIAIIAILAAVLLPKFLGFSQSAKMSASRTDAKNIATAVQALIAQGKTFEVIDVTDTDYGPEAVMGYVGKELGGLLVLAVDVPLGGNITSFTYTRDDNANSYPVTYNVAAGTFTDGTIAAGTITATAVGTP